MKFIARFKQTASAALFALGAICISTLPSGPAAAAAAAKPTIVLVHGAWADSSGWNGVTAKLQADGYTVKAVADPLRDLSTDAAYVTAITKSVKGPVVLVGHSYGGAVITNAATVAGNVKALVYVSAYAPETGESALALTMKFPGSLLGGTALIQVPLPDKAVDFFIHPDVFRADFAADVPAAQAKLMAVDQRPVANAALGGESAAPAWKTIPSWFVYGSADKAIPPAAHAFMAHRAKAKETVIVAGASHVVMISHPATVAGVIEKAAAATVK